MNIGEGQFMSSSWMRLILLIVIITFVAAFILSGAQSYLSLDVLKLKYDSIIKYYSEYPIQTLAIYSCLYIIVTALSLPGAAVMTLAAGALFGFGVGLVTVSFASTIGATLAFLASRLIVGDYIQDKYGSRLRTINEGFRKDGEFYLLSIRLVPLFPFFLVNLLMGLTPISIISYFIISQIGMLPGTAVYIFAGTQLADLDSIAGIMSPGIIAAFTLLATFPLIAKKVLRAHKDNKIMGKFDKPKSFDYNVMVIGAGSGGLVSAYIAAAVKAKVALVEADKMGGDCLNTGCVPSKALIRSAKFVHDANRGNDFGMSRSSAVPNIKKIMARVKRVIKAIEPHDSIERYSSLGVDCIKGSAMIIDPYHVEVNKQVYSTKNIIIATGARPFIPPIKGLDKVPYYTSDNLWDMQKLPKELVVLGGGPIGCELAQSFQRLGAKVTMVEMAPRLLNREDVDVSELITARFKSEGIKVITGYKAQSIRKKRTEGYTLTCANNAGTEKRISFDGLIVALGRQANVEGYGAKRLGIELDQQGRVAANDFMQTNFPNIYVCGDVTGPYQFTHTASHQAWYCAVNALFSPIKQFRVDYSVIPWATFTDPEVARVGLNEQEAQQQDITYELSYYDLSQLDRALAEEEAHGYLKVLTPLGSDKILGVTFVGAHAGDLIHEFILAMKHGIGLNKILGTIHIYPTMAESVKFTAGVWRRRNSPKAALRLLEVFHRWRL